MIEPVPSLRSDFVEIRDVICHETVESCVRRYVESLRAIVLTGSFARQEATCEAEAGGWRILGDAEFLVVFHAGARLPTEVELVSVPKEIECALERAGIKCQVDLAPVYPRYFVTLEPSIFAYELRACGQVVWGDPQILSLIRALSPSMIPLEDAWRTLSNRMIELLEAACASRDGMGELHYRTVKLYLDMATSLLVFVGAYAPSYLERLRRLQDLCAANTAGQEWPFSLQAFIAEVSTATASKLNGGAWESEHTWQSCYTAISYARLLWRWELSRITGLPLTASDGDLCRSWIRKQPLYQRLRGWLFAIRRGGWLKSWRQWPHWSRLALRASPRYCVYAIASEIVFSFPQLMGCTEARLKEPNWQELLGKLPLIGERIEPPNTPDWQWVGRTVVWNYHELLKPTRS